MPSIKSLLSKLSRSSGSSPSQSTTTGEPPTVATMAAPPVVKTRVLIMSDTHEGFQERYQRTEPWSVSGSFRPPLPKADVLIHSGDLTVVGTMDQYRGALAMLASVDAELKLVIAGNHDLSLEHDYYLHDPRARQIAGRRYDAAFAAEARDLWTGEEARKAGVTYLTEGMYEFTLSNGAHFSVYASPWQPVFHNWAFNYPLTEDRWNPPHLVQASTPLLPPGTVVVPAPPERDPHPIPEGAHVDVVITHGPPRAYGDMTLWGDSAGCPHLLAALDRVRPRLHCFGHIHEAWGAEIVKWKARTTGSEAATAEVSGGGSGDGKDDSGRGSFGETSEVLGSLAPSPASSSGVKSHQKPTDEDAVQRRANYVNVSSDGKRPLKAGDETLLVNSCIMDLQYDATGSAWLVDMDLPLKST